MTAHWGLPDPTAAEDLDAEKTLAFAETFRALTRRIQAFVALSLASLDQMALSSRLKAFGEDRA